MLDNVTNNGFIYFFSFFFPTKEKERGPKGGYDSVNLGTVIGLSFSFFPTFESPVGGGARGCVRGRSRATGVQGAVLVERLFHCSEPCLGWTYRHHARTVHFLNLNE